MNLREFVVALDQVATINIGSLEIEVKVLDVKISYGKARYQVTPIAGTGTTWVESIKIK